MSICPATTTVFNTANARGMHGRNGPGVEILHVFAHNVVYRRNGLQTVVPKSRDEHGEYFIIDGRRVSIRVHRWKRRCRG